MPRNYTILIVLFLMLVSACVSSPGITQMDMTATPLKEITSSASLSTATAMPLALTDIPNPRFVPKQNNLIFIEFFAGT